MKNLNRTYIFFGCQAVNLTAAIIAVTVSALIGAELAPRASFATLPYGTQFAAMTLVTYPASMLMRRFGRKVGFHLGAMLLTMAGLVGYYAVSVSSFWALTASHALLGSYIAFANFYRFAAADGLEPRRRAKAISLVVAGGVVAGIAGPLISMSVQNVPDFAEFSLCYLVLSVLGLITFSLVSMLPNAANAANASVVVIECRVLPQPAKKNIAIAVYISACGYFLMNLLMIQSSLTLNSSGTHFHAMAFAVQAHVMAMFLPSFFVGFFISKLGLRKCILTGFVFLTASTVVAMMSHDYRFMLISLVLLGIGWNITYVGGSTLLTENLNEATRHRQQGVNDSIIALAATLGAFAPAFLQEWLGWKATNGLCLITCLLTFGILYCFRKITGLPQLIKP